MTQSADLVSPVQEPSASASSDASTTQVTVMPPPNSCIYPDYPPYMEAVKGITFDFTNGFRILAPKDLEKGVHLVVTDVENDAVLWNGVLDADGYVECQKKYLINYRFELFDEATHESLFAYTMDLTDKDVLVQLPDSGAVGDSIAWFSYLERFQKQYRCKTHVFMPKHIQELVEKQYPELIFETRESAKARKYYAIYYLGIFFRGDENMQPYDFRLIPLDQCAGQILNVSDLSHIPPRLSFGPRTIQEPYVCIASQGSNHAKHWCNPSGWRLLVKDLKERGYRVLCIDRNAEDGDGLVMHYIPYGCEDFTGNIPLQQRADLIHYADFFVGLPSGLSWLAWCCGVPVVMIAGFSMPFGEFYTPYRVQCRTSCHGCWNDTRYEFDHSDYLWCPKHKGTSRAYECSRAISHNMVLKVIDTIPGVRTHSV